MEDDCNSDVGSMYNKKFLSQFISIDQITSNTSISEKW